MPHTLIHHDTRVWIRSLFTVETVQEVFLIWTYTTFTPGHTSSNTPCMMCTAQHPKLDTRQLGSILTTAERPFCSLYKLEWVSASKKKKNEQDSNLHSHWFFECYFCMINIPFKQWIYSILGPDLASLLYWLLCSQLSTPVPRQTAALVSGHWHAGGGDGGSSHSCREPPAFDRRHRQPHEIQGIHIEGESLRVSAMLSAFEDLPPAAQIYIAVINSSCNWETQTRLFTY